MKKVFNWFSIFILINAFTISVYAQKPDTGFTYKYQSHDNTKQSQSNSRKSFAENAYFTEVSTKAVRHFLKTFSQAENVHWYNAGNGVVAYFTVNNIKTRAAYDKKGHWLYSIRSYGESDLPKKIREKIKCVFYDFSIFYINEITTNRELSYKVQIENESSWKIIQVFDDDITVIKEYTKPVKNSR